MNTEIFHTLTNNGIAVIATDTLYGVLGNASNVAVVQRIYDLKGRDEHKPFIILISTIESLKDFDVVLTDKDMQVLNRLWPAPVTVIVPLSREGQQKFSYLHRGTNELAFRLPAKQSLVELLKETGPLVAPSANPQGQEPAHTIEDARAYFGNKIDIYGDEGKIDGIASTIIQLDNGKITIIRQGAVTVV
jgi:L-threonylcarbamoyladenylate synthase